MPEEVRQYLLQLLREERVRISKSKRRGKQWTAARDYLQSIASWKVWEEEINRRLTMVNVHLVTPPRRSYPQGEDQFVCAVSLEAAIAHVCKVYSLRADQVDLVDYHGEAARIYATNRR